jgi:hypothetical protein
MPIAAPFAQSDLSFSGNTQSDRNIQGFRKLSRYTLRKTFCAPRYAYGLQNACRNGDKEESKRPLFRPQK